MVNLEAFGDLATEDAIGDAMGKLFADGHKASVSPWLDIASPEPAAVISLSRPVADLLTEPCSFREDHRRVKLKRAHAACSVASKARKNFSTSRLFNVNACP